MLTLPFATSNTDFFVSSGADFFRAHVYGFVFLSGSPEQNEITRERNGGAQGLVAV